MALTGPSHVTEEPQSERAVPAKVQPLRATGGPATPAPVEPEAHPSWLREYVAVIGGDRWLVAAIACAALAAGAAWAWLATPVYRADLLVQVEEKKKSGALGELSTFFSESSPAETEVEILRSRTLVGAVVDALKLDLGAGPRRFPLVGGAIARRNDGDAPAGAFLGFGRYGWGGERISLSRLDLGKQRRAAPPVLVAGEAGEFELRSAEGRAIARGAVGQLVRGDGVEIYVSDLRARAGTEFLLRKTPHDKAVAALQRDVRITERGKKTGILQLSLDGADPARITAILDAIAQAYVRQNMDRRSAEAEQTLAFLETQLPALRTEVETAESRLEEFRRRGGGVDVTLETQAAVARSADVEKAIAETRLEIGALHQRFTDAHPIVAAARSRLERLEADRGGVEVRLKKLPEAELESARLLRDVKVATELYVGLLDKAQELRVVKSGMIANVRILDPAVASDEPVSPRRLPILALALVLGLGAGIAAALGRRALDQGVQDPEQIERVTGVPVHAIVPLSERQRQAGQGGKILAAYAPEDVAIESIRSLRTSLKFSMLDRPAKLVAVTGPAPGVGKSFVTLNLAHVIAEGGKRVLVVDGDLRRGRLHSVLGGGRSPGLSEVLGGDAPWSEVIRKEALPGVDFLAGGRRPPNPSVLFESERFARLVAELGAAYDLVLIDTPPILAVTDSALAAAHAHVVLCVLRAGRHPMREVLMTQRRLLQGGVRVDGFVLNGVDLRRGIGAAAGYHYQYSYD
jgi:tyrosine-protein kinase Etk/Wzc